MAHLTITGTDGVTRTIEGSSGVSVMRLVREAGFDELQALCGGCLSCATCHVVVHPEDYPRVGTPSEEECDLLDSSEARSATSRLSCQIIFGDALDGLRVTIVDEG